MQEVLGGASAAIRAALDSAALGLDREILVDLVALAAVAGEHLLVLGPPGTAKSQAVRDGDELEHWYYEGFTLRARKPWVRCAGEHVVPRPANQGTFIVRDPDDVPAGDVAHVSAIEVAGEVAVVGRLAAAGIELTCSHLTAHTLAHLKLAGARTASIRLVGTLVTIGDDRGRVIVFDLERGVVRRELRTR